MQSQYRQVTSKRSVAREAFPAGLIDYDFSIGGNTAWIPSKSYFRIGVKLVGALPNDGTPAVAPILNSDVAFANFCPGNLFDNCIFMAGGQDVSSIVNYAPQAHALKYRLKKSGAWMATTGKDGFGISPHFEQRQNQVASNGNLGGDAGHNFPLDKPNQNVVYFMYQPPIGISDHSKPLGAGEYRYSFNPNTNYKTACVQSKLAQRDSPAEFDFVVDSMELYIHTVKMDISPTGTDVLNLMEHSVQSKKIRENGGEENLDFTIPTSTKAITVFVQSSASNNNTIVPPSNFKCVGGQDATLQSLQLTYANTTKPPTRWTSQYDLQAGVGVNKLQQRYLDSQIESGQAFSSGGSETFASWLESGPYYHYSFLRDKDDRSTQLQLQINYNQMEANANCFVVAHYTREVQLQVQNGFITNINSSVV